MKKFKLKREFIAYGLVGIMGVGTICYEGYYEKNVKPLDKDEITEIETQEIIEVEEEKTYKANDLLVIDKNYIIANLGSLNLTPKYRIIELKKENYDKPMFYNNDLDGKTFVYLNSNLEKEIDNYNSYGILNYRKMDKKNIVVDQEYLLKGVINLNSFLERYGLSNFIKSEYTKEEIDKIYNYINYNELIDNSFKIDNILVVDISNALKEDNYKNYYLVNYKDISLLEQNYIKVINSSYNNQIGQIRVLTSVLNERFNLLEDFNNLRETVEIAITGGLENPEAMYILNNTSILENDFFTVFKLSYQDGFKITSLRDFLQNKELGELIKTSYTKDEIREIDDYINSLELYR